MLVALARAISLKSSTGKSVFLQADIGVPMAETAKGRTGE